MQKSRKMFCSNWVWLVIWRTCILPSANIIRTNTPLSQKISTNSSLSLRSAITSLVHKMLLFRKLTPSLNVQSDSIRAKLSAWLLHISYNVMLIVSQKKFFRRSISKHFQLESGVKMTGKRCSFLPALFFTCFVSFLFINNIVFIRYRMSS